MVRLSGGHKSGAAPRGRLRNITQQRIHIVYSREIVLAGLPTKVNILEHIRQVEIGAGNHPHYIFGIVHEIFLLDLLVSAWHCMMLHDMLYGESSSLPHEAGILRIRIAATEFFGSPAY